MKNCFKIRSNTLSNAFKDFWIKKYYEKDIKYKYIIYIYILYSINKI